MSDADGTDRIVLIDLVQPIDCAKLSFDGG
jgi:hypothetical protein